MSIFQGFHLVCSNNRKRIQALSTKVEQEDWLWMEKGVLVAHVCVHFFLIVNMIHGGQ